MNHFLHLPIIKLGLRLHLKKSVLSLFIMGAASACGNSKLKGVETGNGSNVPAKKPELRKIQDAAPQNQTSNAAAPPGVLGMPDSPLQADQPPGSKKIQIPIEIFGTEGIEGSVTVTLSDSQAKAAKRLWLLVHNVRYPEKASVKINNGAWTALNNTSAEMLGTSKVYGGVGGSLATLKMAVTVEQNVLQAGDNKVTFRFNKSNGHSMGFRIVNFNLLSADEKRIIPDAIFEESVPSNWAPPSSAPEDIAAGKELWTNGQLVSNYLPGAFPIKARCASCHTASGSDLKYFGFSNVSIIERAKFHGLTGAEGEKVASYIRSLPVKAIGRPWNPPYQPGPGTSSKPNSEWAAGAGINNVLDNDWDTIKYIFPNGIKRDVIMEGDTNNIKRYSAHDTPMAFQLPDWNHWLPEIHPLDAFGEAWTAKSPDLRRYKKIRSQLEGKSLDEVKNWYATSTNSSGGTRDPTGYFAFLEWPGEGGLDIKTDLPGADLVSSDGRVKDATSAQKVYSLRLLRLVKIFELQEEFQLTGMGPEVRGTWWAGLDEKETLPRAWIGVNRLIFDTSPFLSNLEPPMTGSTSGNSHFNYDYLSNSWYTLQLLLNAGQRRGTAHNVVDFGYAHGFMQSMNRITNFTQAGHDVIWELKGLDEADNGELPGPSGWSFRRTGLSALAVKPGSDGKQHPFWVLKATPETKAVLSLLQQVNAEKSATWLPEQYITRDGAPFNPTEDGGHWDDKFMLIEANHSNEYQERSAALGNWRYLTMAKETRLLHPALINANLNFAHAFWPGLDSKGVAKNSWLQEIVASGQAPAAPTLALGNAVKRVRTNVPDLVRKTVVINWAPSPNIKSYNIKRSDSPNGSFLTVAFFRTSGTFTDEIPVSGRTYYYRMSTNSDDSESLDSASTAINIAP